MSFHCFDAVNPVCPTLHLAVLYPGLLLTGCAKLQQVAVFLRADAPPVSCAQVATDKPITQCQPHAQAGGGPEEVGGVRLRVELGAHAAALGRRLAEVAARSGANTSVLVFGPRGVGKTLVRGTHDRSKQKNCSLSETHR